MASRIMVITGTDTGVGKTVLTALLLAHGLQQGRNILAMKPFCSGGRQDLDLLDSVQDHRLEPCLLNPFYFDEPVAPLVSQRLHRRKVSLTQALAAVRTSAKQCDILLIEGSGGLLVPLGHRFTVVELIRELKVSVVVVSANRLGTINHTLLTAEVLISRGIRRFQTVLMDRRQQDFSSKTNAEVLRKFLSPKPLISVPFLSGKLASAKVIHRHAARLSGALERILSSRDEA